MRLLLVTNDYPPKPGGIQQYLVNLVKAYPDPILVAAPQDGSTDHEHLVRRSHRRFMWPTGETRRWIVDLIDDFTPDIVLYGAPYPLAQLGPGVRARTGVPYAVLGHGAEITIPAVIPGLRTAVARPLAMADAVLGTSRFTADRLRRLGRREVIRIGAGVDHDRFISEPPRFDGVPVIGCVSRFVPRKRQEALIKAARVLRERAIDVQLLFVGTGRTEGRLRRLAKKEGVTAEFRVGVPWDALPGVYSEMDIFCMPCRSRWGGLEIEGLGLVFLEAASSGRPVLAGDSGGAPETVLPGETGFVVHGVSDIVEAVEFLVEDPERSRQMGAAGRRFAQEEWGWSAVVERLKQGLAPVL